jgi:MFS family permease
MTSETISEKTSTWFALRNPIFKRLWLAMVVSGSCIGAHNTAVYWALHSLGAKTVLISLMATVSALPYTLFTLPAGAIADMVNRKKILLGVQLWHAFLAFALAILWMTHLLNPYLILVSAFLFSAGFAFGSPAHSSVIAEMVSPEELSSAYTLAGLQMDVSGIIGPLLSALLLPLAGVSFIFGANGLGFVFMFLAILQWGAWLKTSANRVAVALNLVPFAGIAFLWFIGVLRDRLGELEDRFFATVFIGSGLLFLAMLFASAAVAGGIIIAYAARPERLLDSATFTFARAVTYEIMNLYAVKMAGVFMISTSTLAVRTAFAPRSIAFLGFAARYCCCSAAVTLSGF